MNILLLILSWGTTFAIVWLQIFKVIDMWPSSIYLVLFLLVGFIVWANTNLPKKEETPKPPNHVKGVK